MALFSSKEFTTLEDLLIEQLEDLYDAEHRLVEALPKLAEAAASFELKAAIEDHLKETKTHVKRLETAFGYLGQEANRGSCDAMKGLIKEGDQLIGAKGNAAVKDAALIAAAQRVEHYEIAGYGAARSFAQQLGRTDVAQLMQQTLNEEGDADKKLTQIAETFANQEAAHAGAVSMHQ